MQFRQGDVLLERVDAVPANAMPKRSPAGRPLLVAPGRGGTRSHVLAPGSDVAAWSLAAVPDETPDYLVVGLHGARLVHEEHAPIDLPQGTYRVVRQREFDPGLAAVRPVLD
ncbi:hypothetical protein IGS68_00905 [Skermanella sp. TT6]|uniref:Uncharacterized protein n=1 Tax=Skermanella cutis TaxID=2775420 RepID=A0ABX7B6Y1_9PROT|nr:hypothetical protein [Skermanella sp. TT6]QQP89873.1 hypothetical protein IGS68_00905 [Skermanella sp. TT6]